MANRVKQSKHKPGCTHTLYPLSVLSIFLMASIAILANAMPSNSPTNSFIISINSSSGGAINFNGLTINTTAKEAVLPGNYPIKAIPEQNFTFGGWTGAGIYISNKSSENTTADINGNGTISALFNPEIYTTFSESALPNNAPWSVEVANTTSNAIAGNSIEFLLPNGIYNYSVQNVVFGNEIFTPYNSIGNVTAGTARNTVFYLNNGNTVSPNTALNKTYNTSNSITTSTTSSSTSTSSPTTSIPQINHISSSPTIITTASVDAVSRLFRSNGVPSDFVFITNSSISVTDINGTIANIIAPVQLNYSEMSNLTSLNQSQLANTMKLIGNQVHVFNKTITLPYGMVMQNSSYVKAGRKLNYIAYNTHGIATLYKVSIEKAVPRLTITANGATISTPNVTSKIYIPIMPGQTSYKITLSLESSLISGNPANYSYNIIFSNNTAINGSINSSNVSYSKVFTLHSNETAKIIFDVSGNANYTAEDPGALVIPAQIEYYVPITLSNSQTAPTPSPFQEMLSVNSLSYNSYETNSLNNIEFFYADGNVIPSWMEGSASNTLLNTVANSPNLYTSTNTIYWLNISNGIPASNSITIYMGFAPTSQNLLNNINVGEAPQLSATYAQYDDGPTVFDYYNVNPASTAGWAVVGSAGQTPTAPSGSGYSTTNALYANSANGDYLDTSVPSLTVNEIISFDVRTSGLGNLFFLTSSGGAGQMGRLDGRGGGDYSGLAGTSSWTSWSGPASGLSETTNTWYKYDIMIAGSTTTSYIGPSNNLLGAFGTLANTYTATNDGNYIGLVGDALGGQFVTYWNSMIIRALPPNDIMPGSSFGSVASSLSPLLLIQTNPTVYGNTDSITATAHSSSDSIEILKNGTVIVGPTANTISYTVCDTTPSLGSCWIPGNYIITATDITSGLSTNGILRINKALPVLTLSSPNVVFSGTSTNINYGISTVGNQLAASLQVNGAIVSSTSTNSVYSVIPNNGIYTIQANTIGNSNYTSANVITKFCAMPAPSAFPVNVIYYAPICISNNQSAAAPVQFQQMINITESTYSTYLTYNGNIADFEVFNAIGAVQPAWIEKNQSGKLVIWAKIANGVEANSISPLYLGFANTVTNLLSASGTTGIGEAPAITSTYGQYDDGTSVFGNYFSGNSVTGWTVAGTAGQTVSAPSGPPGSPFGTHAFYADGANGDYLDTIAGNQTANMIIEYYTYTANLDDLFFLANSAGSGQIGRVGNGNGWYGIASAASWTSWSAPPDTGLWSNKWLLLSIVVNSGSAQMSVSVVPGIYGSEIGQNASNIYTVSNKGNYIGLVGDAASGIQYWNGVIIRELPPNGVMPSNFFGSVYSAITPACLISLSPSAVNFGLINPGTSSLTNNQIVDTNSGSASAYMYVYGGNWISSPSSFGVSNTSWSPSSGITYAAASKLGPTAANTLISVASSSSNSIYFGLNIPAAQSAGTYNQIITIENSC